MCHHDFDVNDGEDKMVTLVVLLTGEVVLIVPQVVVRLGSVALVVAVVMVDAVVVVVLVVVVVVVVMVVTVVLVVTVVVVRAVVAIVLVVNSLICTPKNSNHVRSQ